MKSNRPSLFRQSLRWRFAGPIVMVSVLLMVVFAGLRTLMMIQSLRKDLEHRIQTVTELSALILQEPVWNYHTPGILAGVEALMEEEVLGGVVLTDQYGNLLASRKKTGVAHSSAYLFERTADIVRNDELIGRIQLQFTRYPGELRIRNEVNMSLAEVTIYVLLLPVVIILVTRKITRPLMDMMKYTDEISRGNLSVSVVVGTRDEIGLLAEQFNNMAGKLKQMLDNVRQAGSLVTEAAHGFLQSTERTENLAGEMVGEESALFLNDRDALPPSSATMTNENEMEPISSLTKQFFAIIERFGQRTEKLEKTNSLLSQALVQLREAQAQMVESEKMAALGSLVAGVAHEINTPLGIGVTLSSHIGDTARAFSEKIQIDSAERQDLFRFLSGLSASTKLLDENLRKAAKLVANFKMLAVDQSREPLSVFSLRDNIDGVFASLGHDLRKAGVLAVNECPALLMLNSHPGAFGQIFINLVLNSLRHGFAGRASGEIHIRTDLERDRLLVTYEDDGNGIAEAVMEKIYQPFFTTNRQGGSTGLGMNIIFNLVTQKLGGTISCKSQAGKGVCFTIALAGALVVSEGKTTADNGQGE